MILQKRFIRFTSICCFLSVITTFGIHAFFPDPPASFDERVMLFRDPVYLINRWWVILHCLFVICAMWGFALLQFRQSPGTIGLGFLFFTVFAIAEITRQMVVLFYFNGLREQFVLATDPALKENLRATLMTAGLSAAHWFGVFILMFGLGSTCYGLSLILNPGFERILAVMLLISGLGSFLLLANDFWKNETIGKFMDQYNSSFTPLLRLLIGIWLWRKAERLPVFHPLKLQPV